MNALMSQADTAGMLDGRGRFDTELAVQTHIWRPASPDKVTVETIAGDDTYLRFVVPELYVTTKVERWGWTPVDSTDQLFDQFIEIESPKQALRFAQSWGPLWLVEVFASAGGYFWNGILRWKKDGTVLTPCPWSPLESVDAWLRLAARLRATVDLIAVLNTKTLGAQSITREMWEKAGYFPGPDFDLRHTRRVISALIDQYCADADWGPRFRMAHTDLRLSIDTGLGFLPAVWWALAQLASRTNSIFQCKGCDRTVMNTRDVDLQRTSYGKYCSDCQKNKYNLSKERDYNDRHALLQELAAFFLARPSQEINQTRVTWNDDHLDQCFYRTNEKFLKDLNAAANGSYRALNATMRDELDQALCQAGHRDTTRLKRDRRPKQAGR